MAITKKSETVYTVRTEVHTEAEKMPKRLYHLWKWLDNLGVDIYAEERKFCYPVKRRNVHVYLDERGRLTLTDDLSGLMRIGVSDEFVIRYIRYRQKHGILKCAERAMQEVGTW
jgi:hypothetical protein